MNLLSSSQFYKCLTLSSRFRSLPFFLRNSAHSETVCSSPIEKKRGAARAAPLILYGIMNILERRSIFFHFLSVSFSFFQFLSVSFSSFIFLRFLSVSFSFFQFLSVSCSFLQFLAGSCSSSFLGCSKSFFASIASRFPSFALM